MTNILQKRGIHTTSREPQSNSNLVTDLDNLRALVLALFSVALGGCYVFIIRPGLPYDEPSHFHVVQYYARGGWLPVLGQPGVDYEAYQPPLYYVLNAALYRLAAVGGDECALYALRAASALLLAPIVFLSYWIARRAFPCNRPLVMAAVLFTALNPSLLGIISSVQNDGLAIILCLVITCLSLHWLVPEGVQDPPPRFLMQHFFVLGLLTALAILTKLSAAFLVLAVPLLAVTLARHQDRSSHTNTLRAIVLFFTTVAVFTGWWFVRNHAVYGDFSGGNGLRRYFPEIISAQLHLWKLHDLLLWARELVTYHWLPVEHYRNIVKSPFWLDTVIIGGFLVASLAGWVGLCAQWRRRAGAQSVASPLASSRTAVFFLAIQYVLCLGVWSWICSTQWRISARSTLPTFIVFALLFCGGGLFAFHRLNRISPKIFGPKIFVRILCAALFIANAYILLYAYYIPILSFQLFR